MWVAVAVAVVQVQVFSFLMFVCCFHFRQIVKTIDRNNLAGTEEKFEEVTLVCDVKERPQKLIAVEVVPLVPRLIRSIRWQERVSRG